MSRLEKIWEAKNHPALESIDNFVKFLKVEKEKLDSMNFTELENLQVVKEHELISCGGKYDYGDGTFKWHWTKLDEPTQTYIGSGQTYDEAALTGLFSYWELITLREKASKGLW